MKAHPTTYNGMRFRSRLEAKWAAFFDKLGARWEYEPEDLSGWVPDFYLIFDEGTLPVEVKPINWHNNCNAGRICNDMHELKKVRDYKKSNVLILGSYPIGFRKFEDDAFRKLMMKSIGLEREGGDFGIYKLGVYWFTQDENGYYNDCIGFNFSSCILDYETADLISKIWREACSMVQWRAA